MTPSNADYHAIASKVSQSLDRLHGSRSHLNQLWHVQKMKLEQCFQLRLFEQDVEQVSGFHKA